MTDTPLGRTNLLLAHQRYAIQLRWAHPEGFKLDLDLQALAVSDRGQLLDAVCFSNLHALGGCLAHSRDDLGDLRDDESISVRTETTISVNLDRAPLDLKLLLFVVAAFRGGNQLCKSSFDIFENAEGGFRSLSSFELPHTSAGAAVVAVMQKQEGGKWSLWRVPEGAQAGCHFVDILEPCIGDIVRRAIAGELRMDFVMDKGQVVDLPQSGSLGTIYAAVGCDSHKAGDMDISAVLFDSNCQNLETIFFGMKSGCGVTQGGERKTGQGLGNDEWISVKFWEVPEWCTQIFVTVNVYTQDRNFANFKHPHCRIVTGTGHEICRYELQCVENQNGLIIARLFREENRWGVQALGRFCRGTLWKDLLPDMQRIANQIPQAFQQDAILLQAEADCKPGEHVGYYSKLQDEWMEAVVVRVHANGTIDLDREQNVDLSCVRKKAACANRCGRPAALGYEACCRTCTASGGMQHGPLCQQLHAKAAARLNGSLCSQCAKGDIVRQARQLMGFECAACTALRMQHVQQQHTASSGTIGAALDDVQQAAAMARLSELDALQAKALAEEALAAKDRELMEVLAAKEQDLAARDREKHADIALVLSASEVEEARMAEQLEEKEAQLAALEAKRASEDVLRAQEAAQLRGMTVEQEAAAARCLRLAVQAEVEATARQIELETKLAEYSESTAVLNARIAEKERLLEDVEREKQQQLAEHRARLEEQDSELKQRHAELQEREGELAIHVTGEQDLKDRVDELALHNRNMQEREVSLRGLLEDQNDVLQRQKDLEEALRDKLRQQERRIKQLQKLSGDETLETLPPIYREEDLPHVTATKLSLTSVLTVGSMDIFTFTALIIILFSFAFTVDIMLIIVTFRGYLSKAFKIKSARDTLLFADVPVYMNLVWVFMHFAIFMDILFTYRAWFARTCCFWLPDWCSCGSLFGYFVRGCAGCLNKVCGCSCCARFAKRPSSPKKRRRSIGRSAFPEPIIWSCVRRCTGGDLDAGGFVLLLAVLLPANVLFFYPSFGRPIFTEPVLADKDINSLLKNWPEGGGMKVDESTRIVKYAVDDYTGNLSKYTGVHGNVHISSKECYEPGTHEYRILGRLRDEGISTKQAYCDSVFGTTMVNWAVEDSPDSLFSWQSSDDIWEESFDFVVRLFAAFAGLVADHTLSKTGEGFLEDMMDVFDMYMLSFEDPRQMHEGRPLLETKNFWGGFFGFHSLVRVFLYAAYFTMFLRAVALIAVDPTRKYGNLNGLDMKRLINCTMSLLFVELPFLYIRGLAWYHYYVPVSVLAIKNFFGIYRRMAELGLAPSSREGIKPCLKMCCPKRYEAKAELFKSTSSLPDLPPLETTGVDPTSVGRPR